ncbi:hypothetical protein AB0I69_07410 [Streptomyces sp. NPDC050508]|uniref:hypothetical protein n=1 Tax=Streptomyces sp. NPDC050508 TaxID=3155405 RepID=UPI00341A4FAB
MSGAPLTSDQQRQLETAVVVLGLVGPMVDDDVPLTAEELRWAAGRLVDSLANVLGIVVGQGRTQPKPGREDRSNAPALRITHP